MSMTQYAANWDRMVTTRTKNELLELHRQKKIDLNGVDEHGNTVLHLIIKNVSLTEQDIIELLEAFLPSCNVNATNTTNETPLHLTSERGNIAIARKLIASGAAINCKNSDGHTPLNHAVYHYKNLELIEFLLESGANVNSKDNSRRRPLCYAASFKQSIQMVPLLLKWGAYVNDYALYDESPFARALKWRSFHNAREMLAYGADINEDAVIYTNVELFSCGSRFFAYAPSMEEEFLVEHWVKLKAVGLPCSEEYEALSRCRPYQLLYQECLREVETLKATFVGERTSIYAFLHMDYGRRCAFFNNEELQGLVQCPKLMQRFPQYYVLILAGYRETVAWKKLLEPAKEAWLKLTEISLPNICIERIFAYLRNEDLVCMIECDEDE